MIIQVFLVLLTLTVAGFVGLELAAKVIAHKQQQEFYAKKLLGSDDN